MGSLLPHREDVLSQQLSWTSGSHNLPMPLSVIVPNLRCMVGVADQPVGVGQPTVTYYLHFEQLWCSVIVLMVTTPADMPTQMETPHGPTPARRATRGGCPLGEKEPFFSGDKPPQRSSLDMCAH